jgi:hypothetical protein
MKPSSSDDGRSIRNRTHRCASYLAIVAYLTHMHGVSDGFVAATNFPGKSDTSESEGRCQYQVRAMELTCVAGLLVCHTGGGRPQAAWLQCSNHVGHGRRSLSGGVGGKDTGREIYRAADGRW